VAGNSFFFQVTSCRETSDFQGDEDSSHGLLGHDTM